MTAQVLLPTQLGDSTASLPTGHDAIVTKINTSGDYSPLDAINGLGSDSVLYPGFLSLDEADQAFDSLLSEEEFQFQQWYHMPDRKTGRVDPLRRVKIAMATPDPTTGLIPHYRFPVNDQKRYGTLVPMSPTIENLRQRVNALLGIDFNHSVVLLYRNGDDCIGYHKDKTLDLDETAPIVSISLGIPRLYIIRDTIHNPNVQQEFVLPHGALFVLGCNTNQNFYHSIRPSEDIPPGTLQQTARISITFRKVLTYRQPNNDTLLGKGADYQTLNWPEQLRGAHCLDQIGRAHV